MNDQQALELINRSLCEPLSDRELTELNEHLARSPQSREYLRLSQQIQQTLSHPTVESEAGPGLSQIALSRLARCLTTEIAASQLDPSSQARRVAENDSDYQIGKDHPQVDQ